MLAHPAYRAIRPLAERVLGTTETGSFALSAAASKPAYRVLAWNLERGIEYEGQLAEIRGHPYLGSVDVFLLTETDVGMARSANRNVARELARNLGLDYAFAPCYLNLSKGVGVENEAQGRNELGLHGNAILSRYPIRNPRPIQLGNGRDKMRGNEKRLGQQVALAAEIGFPGFDLTVCSVHLDAQSRQRHRRDQMAAVVDGLPPSGPAVIGGGLEHNHVRLLERPVGHRWLLGSCHAWRGQHDSEPLPASLHLVRARAVSSARAAWIRLAGRKRARRATTSYDVEDVKTHENLREWVPAWCFDFIRWALRDFDGKCPLKIDWFAVREVKAAAPVVLHEFREAAGRRCPTTMRSASTYRPAQVTQYNSRVSSIPVLEAPEQIALVPELLAREDYRIIGDLIEDSSVCSTSVAARATCWRGSCDTRTSRPAALKSPRRRCGAASNSVSPSTRATSTRGSRITRTTALTL